MDASAQKFFYWNFRTHHGNLGATVHWMGLSHEKGNLKKKSSRDSPSPKAFCIFNSPFPTRTRCQLTTTCCSASPQIKKYGKTYLTYLCPYISFQSLFSPIDSYRFINPSTKPFDVWWPPWPLLLSVSTLCSQWTVSWSDMLCTRILTKLSPREQIYYGQIIKKTLLFLLHIVEDKGMPFG